MIWIFFQRFSAIVRMTMFTLKKNLKRKLEKFYSKIYFDTIYFKFICYKKIDWEEKYRAKIKYKHFLITVYNTVILVRSVIKFLNRNFLFIEKVLAFLDSILSRAIARNKILCIYVVAKNSVIGNFFKRLCTCLISIAISIDQISFETKQK